MVVPIADLNGKTRLHWKKNKEMVSTEGMKGKHPNRAAYGMDRYGNLYLHEHITKISHPEMRQPFFHSSFFSGRPGKCFGMIEVKNGRVKHINNYSGHYRPLYEHLMVASNHLKDVLSKKCEIKHIRLEEDQNDSQAFGFDGLFGW